MEAQRTVRPGGGGERLEQRDRDVCVLRVGAVGVSDSFMVCACEIHRLAVAARPPCARPSDTRAKHTKCLETGGQN